MKRYLANFENHSVRLMEFASEDDPTNVVMTWFRVVQGSVETVESEMTMPQSDIQTMVSQALANGVVEVDKNEFLRASMESKQTLLERFRERDGENNRLMEWREVSRSVPTLFANNPQDFLSPHLLNFRIYEQETRIRGNLKIDFDTLRPEIQTGSRNLVFAKGLTIEGDLDAGSQCTCLPQFLHIEGDLHVHNLILTGWVDIVVTGNLIASGVVLGCDGESGGRLHVGGSLNAKAMLGGSMFQIKVLGAVNTQVHWIDDEEPTFVHNSVVPSSIGPVDWPHRERLTVLSDSAYHEDTDWGDPNHGHIYNLNIEFIVDTLRKGLPLFRE